MTHRERILTVLSGKPADRVPLDLAGFNREAYRLFIEKTGSRDPWEYFGVEADWRGIGFGGSKDEIDHRPFHRNLPEDTPLNEWGTAFIVGSNSAYDHFVAPMTYAKELKEILSAQNRWDGLCSKWKHVSLLPVKLPTMIQH